MKQLLMKSLLIVLLSSAYLIGVAQAENNTANDADISSADKFRKIFVRYNGADEPAATTDYAIGVAIYAVVPLVIAIITLLVAFFFCICRLCNCCVRPPKDQGYTCRERWVPFGLLAMFLALCFAFAVTGLTNNSKFSEDFSKGDGSIAKLIPSVFDIARSTLNDGRRILTNFSGSLNGTVNDVNTILVGTVNVVSSGTTSLVNKVATVGSTFNNYSIYLNGTNQTVTCSYCASIGSQTNQIATDINGTVNPKVTDINNTVQNVQKDLVNIVNDIVRQVNDVLSQTNNVQDQLDKANNQTSDIIDQVKDYDNKRFIGTLVLFLVPLACVVIILVALILKNSMLFKTNVWIGFLVMFLMWLLLAIHLPSAIGLSDGCYYLHKQQKTLVAESSSAARIMRTCLSDGSVADEYNLTSYLNFSNSLKFPSTVNFTQLLDSISSLDSFSNSINQLTLESFGWNDTKYITDPLAQLSGQLGTVYTEANISSLDPNTYNSNATKVQIATDGKAAITGAINDRTSLNNSVNSLKNNVTSTLNVKADLAALLDNAQKNVSAIQNLTQPYIDLANQLLNLTNCSSVGHLYLNLKRTTCNQIVDDIAGLAMALFFVGMFIIPVIILSQVSASRIPHPWKTDFVSNDVPLAATAYNDVGSPTAASAP